MGGALGPGVTSPDLAEGLDPMRRGQRGADAMPAKSAGPGPWTWTTARRKVGVFVFSYDPVDLSCPAVIIPDMRDPLGIDPIQHIQEIVNPGGARAIAALKHGVVTRDVTVLPSARTEEERAAVVALPGPKVVGQDGKPLTLEDRQRIAAERNQVPVDRGGVLTMAYDEDLEDLPVAPLGTAAQAIINAQPDMRLHETTEAIIKDLPT